MTVDVVHCPTCGHPVNWSDELHIDFKGNKVTVQGKVIKMRPCEVDILWMLSQRAPRTITTAQLAHDYAPREAVSEDTIDVYICGLRKKLRGTAYMIENIRPRQYRLVKSGV